MDNNATTKFSKQLLCLAGTLTITLSTIAGPTTFAQELTTKSDKKIQQSFEQVVNIPDPDLRLAITQDLNIPANQPIYTADMLRLTDFYLVNRTVSNLEGLQYATNLKSLRLSNNKIKDITHLQNLSKLEELLLETNKIEDITALKELRNIKKLELGYNSILDLTPLAGKNMEYFSAKNQSITPETVHPYTDGYMIFADVPMDISGPFFILSENISDGGGQNLITNQVQWSNITQERGSVQYVWDQGAFSGTYRQSYQNEAPTAGTVTPDTFTIGKSTAITGAYTGDVASMKVNINGTDYDGTVANGEIHFEAADKIQAITDQVTVTVYDAKGKELDKENVVVDTIIGEGTITPNAFVVGTDRYLEGSYTGDVVKIAVKVNDTLYNGGTVTDGNIKFYAHGKIKATTDKVVIYAYDELGHKIDEKEVVLQETILEGTITPNKYQLGTDKYLNGSYTGDVHRVKIKVNDKEYAGGTLTDGTFQIYAYDKIKNLTDKVTIYAYDKNGKQLDEEAVTVSNTGEGTVSPDAYTFGTSKYVTGTYTGDVVKMELDVDGTIYKGGTVTDGKINFYAHGKIKADSKSVNVLVYDKNGHVIDTKPVTLN